MEVRASSTAVGFLVASKAALNAKALCDKFPVSDFSTGYLDHFASYSRSYLLGGTTRVERGGNTYDSLSTF